MGARIIDQLSPIHVVNDQSEYGLLPSLSLNGRSELFGLGNFERVPDSTGRTICPGDSGGPVMSITNGVATLVGTIKSGTNKKGETCAESKQVMYRYLYDLNYYGNQPMQIITRIPVTVAVKIGVFVYWINFKIETKKNNIQPFDKFNSTAGGLLFSGPAWGANQGIGPTVAPHPQGIEITIPTPAP